MQARLQNFRYGQSVIIVTSKSILRGRGGIVERDYLTANGNREYGIRVQGMPAGPALWFNDAELAHDFVNLTEGI